MNPHSPQRSANDRLWARVDLLRHYLGSELRPVEEVVLGRYGSDLGGRVLEVGAGGGRLTGHLAGMATRVTAIDVSPTMAEALSGRYPNVTVEVRDMRDLSGCGDDTFDAVVAGYNVPDVLDHAERSTFLDEAARVLGSSGLLIMSTHNLASDYRITEPFHPPITQPKQVAALVLHGLRWRRNRRRRLPHERRGDSYAILNDVGHDFEALHYYIHRDDQERQLRAHGYELLECLDLEGGTVAAGEDAAETTELHYVARPVPAA